MVCQLCHKPKELLNSHILPEFLYKPLYEKKKHPRFLGLSTLPEVKNKYEQKGIREKLFCFDCEQHFNQYETYASKIFNQKIKINYENFENYLLLKGLDYKKFKLFLMSLLWRAGVSNHKFFKYVQLGPHEKKIRSRLLLNDPGKFYEYGAIVIFLIDEGKPFNQFIMQPEQIDKIDGFRIFRFIFGGAMWLFIVSSHNHLFPAHSFFIQENGHLPIKFCKIDEVSFLARIAKEWYLEGKLKM